MRFVIAGGGTGGHIYPAVAVAERLSICGDVIMLARSGSMEERIFKTHGLEVRTIQSAPLLPNPKALWRFLKTVEAGTANARHIMNSCKPDAFIGTGGYVSVPGILAARQCHIPIFLLEQNSVMGRANRLFAHYACKVFLGFPLCNGSENERFVLTGNPVRKSVYQSLLEGRDHLAERKGLLFLGGSGGASFINGLFLQTVQRFEERARDIDIYAVTGEDGYDAAQHAVERLLLQHVRPHVLPYEERMERLYAQASVAVSRGGALALTELAVGGIYTLIIPYPYAVGQHQSKNAAYLESLGLGKRFEQKNFDFEQFYSVLCMALDRPRNVSNLPDPFGSDAADVIVSTIKREVDHD